MAEILSLNIQSEIGELEGVILHTPGAEVENMTPGTAQRALYSDILNLSIAKTEYDQLQGVLGKYTRTFQVTDLLEQVLANYSQREMLIKKVCESEGALEYYEQLMAMPSAELAKALIEGVPARKNTLTAFLSDEYYALAICNGILGAGTSSKLFRNVREKNSLAYYAASRLIRSKGIIVAYSGIEPENYEKAKSLILDQLKEIQSGNVTRAEYADTVKMYVNSFNSYKDTVFSIMDFYLGEILMGTDLTIDGFIEKLQMVTIEQVVNVSKKINPDTIYFLGPDKEGK